MEPHAPETVIATPKPITEIAGRNIIEIPSLSREITIRGDEIGVSLWPELAQLTQGDLRERYTSVIKDKRTKKIEIMPVISGEPAKKNQTPHLTPQPLPFLKARFSDRLSDIHTHPLDQSADHIKTTWPSDADILPLTIPNWRGVRIVIDRGGAHLLVKSSESSIRDVPPDPNLIQYLFQEVAQNHGTSTDIQKGINNILHNFGITYFYRDSLYADEDGTVTFTRP